MSSSDGFRTVNQTVVHSWAMFSLLQSSVEAPSGEIFERTYVHTPGAVGIVTLTEHNDIVLVSQYRASCDSSVLEIPAGMRDKDGEDPRVTAIRELQEETGYSGDECEFIGEMLSSPGVTDSAVIVYLMRGVVPGVSQPEGPEEQSMTMEVVPFATALLWVESGKIADSKSAFGILLVARKYPHLVG